MSKFIAPLNQDVNNALTNARLLNSIANPTTAPILTLTTDGGATLQLVTYYVAYTWVSAFGESLPSASASVAVTAGKDITATIPALPAGVTSANVYISELPNNLLLQGSTATTSYVQSTAITNSKVNPPVSNGTGQWVTSTKAVPSDTLLAGVKAMTTTGVAIAASAVVSEVFISADAAILIGNAASQVLAIPANTNFGPLKVSNLATVFAKTVSGTGNLAYIATV